MAVISLKNVSYRYPLEENQVIKNVSFEIEKGQVWGLIGANESGKTSICNIIRGFIPEIYRGELEGEVEIKGKKIESYGDGELASVVGYSFQNPFTQISGVKETVYEELAYGMENIGVPRDEMIDRVEKLIQIFHLEKLKDKNPFQLSGGQKQRVALASMIALDPEIVILDEPTSQLDPQSTEEIFEIIQRLHKAGTTILLVEQNAQMALSVADRAYVLETGKISLSGTGTELAASDQVRKAYLGG